MDAKISGQMYDGKHDVYVVSKNLPIRSLLVIRGEMVT